MRDPYSTKVTPDRISATPPKNHPASVQQRVFKRIAEAAVELSDGTQAAYEEFMAVKLLGPFSDETAATIVLAGAIKDEVNVNTYNCN